jgi:NitT/TauT family transport system substrate-binding protein
MRKRWVVSGLIAAAVAVAAAAAVATHASAAPKQAKLVNITLQSKWVPQAQFAGYYAALAKGYYKAAGLNVTIKPGGPDIIPEQVVASGQAQFGIDWLPSLLSFRDHGTDLVNIAQVFARSGMTELTWKSSGIDTIAKMRGKRVSNWLGGNQYELFAALKKYGMDPERNKGVTIVRQPTTMGLFLHHRVAAASAMTYNELAQVLEATNPKTGKLYTLRDLNVLKMQQVGTGMLEDGIFTTGAYLKSAAHRATAEKFVAASLAGWIYCRDHVARCVGFTPHPGSGVGHQTWMLNEINKLIWPNGPGIGLMNGADFVRTAHIMREFGGITKQPTGAYRTDLARAALRGLAREGLDVHGRGYKPLHVKLRAGGR